MGKVNGILLSWAPKGVLLYAKPYVEMNRLHAEDVNNKLSSVRLCIKIIVRTDNVLGSVNTTCV